MMREKWWLSEEPQTIHTSKNTLRWYPKAGKLQVARPDWENDAGERKPGKTVTLDMEALQHSDDAHSASELFRSIAGILGGEADG